MSKILAAITSVLVIIIAVVSLVNIDLAIKIGVNAITAVIIIGILTYVSNIFGSR